MNNDQFRDYIQSHYNYSHLKTANLVYTICMLLFVLFIKEEWKNAEENQIGSVFIVWGLFSYIYKLNLNTQKKSSGIFNKFLNSNQECNSLTAINKSVIIGEGNIHHGTDLNLYATKTILVSRTQTISYSLSSLTFPLTAMGLSLIECIPKIAV